MATIPKACGFLSHTLRFSQEYRFTVKTVCDGCACTVQTNGFGFGYYTCDQCGYKACARCASLIQGQTNNNVGQVQESSSWPTAVHSWSSWVQQQPSSNPANQFASSATTNHSPASQQRSNPPNPFASSAATNHSEAQQQRSNLPNTFASSAATKNSQSQQQWSKPPNLFASSATTKNSQPQQQRSNPPNPFASSADTDHSEAQQQRSNLPNPFASSAATNYSQSQQQWSNLPNLFASSATTKNSQPQQQRSNPPNPFASSAATNHSEAQQQRSNLPTPFASSAATNYSQSQQQRSNLPNPFASSAATNYSQSQQQWSNLPNLFASSATTKNSQPQQQRSNPPNPFASSATTKNSQSQQQRTTTQGRPPNGGPGQARRIAKGRSGKQRTPNGPEVSHGSLQQKETVNATQSSPSSPSGNLHEVNDSDNDDPQYHFLQPSSSVEAPQPSSSSSQWSSAFIFKPSVHLSLHLQEANASSSPWGNLHEGNDSGDHEQQKRAVNVAQSSHASPPARGLDVDVSDEKDDEKQPVIPCAGSLVHELQFLQRSPYKHLSVEHSYVCDMCYKAGSKDLYHCEICQFDTHKACAEIQKEVKVFFHKHPLQRDHTYDEEFTCRFCVGDTEADIRPWVYKCLNCPNFTVHARCAKYAKSLKHKSHPHMLKLVQNPVIGDSPEVCCDGCCNSIHQGYHYTCTEPCCDFDLHPSCAILPSAPLCRLNPNHRVKLDFHLLASEKCYLCLSQDDEDYWVYRCTVCNVCMHIDCFNLVTELSDSDEELSDGDEEDEDFGELYQKFLEFMEDFGSQGNEEQVEKLFEHLDSFKINT